MLKLKNINKRFKSVIIADGINIELDRFTYGLLGRNGSGKTTLMRCITKIERPNSGQICCTVDDKETEDYLGLIGYLPQNFDIFNELTPYEILEFFANLKGCKITGEEKTELLKMLNLTDKKDTLVKNLSGGMKRRLGIAQALIGSPDILLLDEPTSGLDPEERINFKNVIRKIKKDKCVVLSTHIITDIESLCDKILILSNGKIRQFDSCGELARVAEKKVFAVESTEGIDCDFYSAGTVAVNGKNYEKIICRNKIDALELEPTVEDGYICFTENLS